MKKTEVATFAAGCFWEVELEFSKIPGVLKTRAGYMGGNEDKYKNPSYEQVCSDKTGYAEVVRLEFDPAKVNYERLLDIFWNIHDPRQLNRQGHDIGTQYRSCIFYYNDKQKKTAEKSKSKMQKKFDGEIVTEIKKAGTFFEAEQYHQKYLEKRGKNVC